jgi:hypothetical protein
MMGISSKEDGNWNNDEISFEEIDEISSHFWWKSLW